MIRAKKVVKKEWQSCTQPILLSDVDVSNPDND